MSAAERSEMPAPIDLEVNGTTYRRNIFGEWCEVSAESGELHVAYQESDCLDEIERLRCAGDAVVGLLRCFVNPDTDELAASVLNQWENPQ